MDFLTLFMTAVGLAMDAFSVSVSNGTVIRKKVVYYAVKFGLFFGFAQFLMPCIGWALGCSFLGIIQKYAPWIAFLLLGFIGGKMIWEAISESEEECEKNLGTWVMIVMAVATSIDALAVGVTFAAMGMGDFGGLGMSLIPNSLVIGITSFVISGAGVIIGSKCGNIFGNKAEIGGGIVLIAIGIKILLEGIL